MILADEQATNDLGRRIARTLRAGDVIALSGALGVGKTALARAILAELGHEGEVPSPSFAIIQPYDELELPVWHVDLFRIEDVGELEELGLEAAWPQALGLTLEFVEGGARRLKAKVPASWQSRWPPR